MVDPARLPGDHILLICGNEAAAKTETTQLLGEFGWPAARVLDLGDITAARATEMYVLLWVRMMGVMGTPYFSIALAQ
jgi:predicted dinucleotide-binding enzyme